METKEFCYWYGKRWDFSIDLTRWVFGIEWYRENGWIEFNLGCFTSTVWWKNRSIF